MVFPRTYIWILRTLILLTQGRCWCCAARLPWSELYDFWRGRGSLSGVAGYGVNIDTNKHQSGYYYCYYDGDRGGNPGAPQLRVSGPWSVQQKTQVHDDRDVVAEVSYVDSGDTVSNFGVLDVVTDGMYSDQEQMFAAGYVEGYVTAERIAENFANLHYYFTETMGVALEEPMGWVLEQDGWVRERCDGDFYDGDASSTVNTNTNKKKRFWRAVCLAVKQFDGIVAGYQAKQDESDTLPDLKYADFLFLESNGDLYDVIDSMFPEEVPRWNVSSSTMSRAEFLNSIALHQSKCSALVKLAPDLSELYMGHSTWDSYTAMLRVYKHYTFNLTDLKPAAQGMSFSSYPGEVFSDDDFYLLSSNIVVLQTTNKIFDASLLDPLKHKTHVALSWQRTRAANFLSTNGEEWAEYFKMENSGTYNNQYMVIDLDKFDPEKRLVLPGLLTVIEQVPGLVKHDDMTRSLLLGYWPSMNIPYFTEIYKKSGYPDFTDPSLKENTTFYEQVLWLSYDASPRSNIFRRDHSSVTSLETMQDIMRQNDYKNDPLSKGNPIYAICGRGDLSEEAPETRGCYDTKVTTYEMAKRRAASAVNGPTRGTGNLAPFFWPEDDPQVHQGQPTSFDFDFEIMQPMVSV
jgi:hypothetical protein